MPATIAVAGNINFDLSYAAERLPRPGETLLAKDLVVGPGGKAANQAVAVARLGGRARLVGSVGEDPLAAMALENLRREGVDTEAVVRRAGATTGAASVMVLDAGENAIITSLGANMTMTPDEVPDIAGCDAALMTLGLPAAVLTTLANAARAQGVPVVVDATPLRGEVPRALTEVAVLSANRIEAMALAGTTDPDADPERLSESLLDLGATQVVIKLGAEGALWHNGERSGRVEAPVITAVDSTGAGDAFTAGFALRFIEKASMEECTRFACAAGALAAGGRGAQAGLRDRPQVERMLREMAMERKRG